VSHSLISTSKGRRDNRRQFHNASTDALAQLRTSDLIPSAVKSWLALEMRVSLFTGDDCGCGPSRSCASAVSQTAASSRHSGKQ